MVGPADADVPRVPGTLLLRVVPKLSPLPHAPLRLSRWSKQLETANPNTNPNPNPHPHFHPNPHPNPGGSSSSRPPCVAWASARCGTQRSASLTLTRTRTRALTLTRCGTRRSASRRAGEARWSASLAGPTHRWARRRRASPFSSTRAASETTRRTWCAKLGETDRTARLAWSRDVLTSGQLHITNGEVCRHSGQ